MIKIDEALKILNQKEKKYTTEQAKKIMILLYQLGEISYLQFKQLKNHEKETSSTIH